MKHRAWVLLVLALGLAIPSAGQLVIKNEMEPYRAATKFRWYNPTSAALILEVDTSTPAVTSPIADGVIARAALAENALQPYGIPISSLQGVTGIPLVASETAGGFNVAVASHVTKAQAEVTDNETETSVVLFQFVLPPEYVSGGDVSVSLRCAIIKTAAAVDNASTVDVAVYKQADGAVGSDLSTTTSAATFAAVDTWYTKTFVITPTGFAAGDILDVEITSAIVDSEAGGGTLRFNMDPPKVLLDVKG